MSHGGQSTNDNVLGTSTQCDNQSEALSRRRSLSVKVNPRLHVDVAIHEITAHGKGHLVKRFVVNLGRTEFDYSTGDLF